MKKAVFVLLLLLGVQFLHSTETDSQGILSMITIKLPEHQALITFVINSENCLCYLDV